MLVPVLDGRVVGFAWTGLSRDGDGAASPSSTRSTCTPTPGVVAQGPLCCEPLEAEIAGRGHDEAVLWVVPGNTRARRFYERHGWTSDGVERPIEVADGVSVPELRYRRSLPVSDPARR